MQSENYRNEKKQSQKRLCNIRVTERAKEWSILPEVFEPVED